MTTSDITSSPFVHLHVHSAYSLAEGAIQVKKLIKLCQENNMPAVAVTDTNNMFGAMEFAIAAQKSGVQPIIGCQLDFGHERHQLVLLVQNETGYLNLSKLVSDAYMNTEGGHDPIAEWSDLEGLHEGLICLSGSTKGPINQYLLHNQNKEAEHFTKKLKKIFGDRFYIELQRHELIEEDRVENDLIDLAYKHDIPLVATNDCYFGHADMHEAHDALLCIAGGRYVTESDRRTVSPHHYFKGADEMKRLFKDIPEAIVNTGIIARRCSYLLKPIDPILPPFEGETGKNEEEELSVQSKKGLEWRLDNYVDKSVDRQPYYDRLEFELNVIKQMGFPGYFLIVSDFIKWAKERDIPVGPGRGSGAGSVVAWALQITDLDPLQFNLLFERFLNPERVSMPDFDVDFCQERRDEVIRYVQEKYGYDHVAQIITFGKLQARAVVRDVGRVLQMPYGQVDRIAKMIPNNPANPMTLSEAMAQDKDLQAERDKDETTKKLINIALQLEGLYRHASTHAAGVVIGDRPLHELVPLYRDPRSTMPVTQFNMKYVEQTGLVKFDFLGLKTLTVIQRACAFIKDKGIDIDPLKLPLDDQKSYELMSSGHAVGIFQLESSGMRDTLRKLKPTRLEDIIALVSLYRPGPMDNIPRYIKIKEGAEDPDYMHPILQPILEETFGIMIYQEQVMQAAQLLAGYTLGGADLLRRAMGKKIKEAMDAERKKFIEGAKEHHDVSADKSEEIFEQIAKFAGYGFNKSHAAAYALIAYQTAWLKANHPVEFMAASMSLDKGNTDKLAVFKQEMDRMELKVLPPDVNYSGMDFKVEEGSVRYALSALKGVGVGAMEVLEGERSKNGTYETIYDFAERVDPKAMNKRQFEMLAASGAFDALNDNRAQTHAASEMLLRYSQNLAEERETGQSSLFGEGSGSDIALSKPPLPNVSEWDKLDTLSHEFDAVGFYLSAHPLDGRDVQLGRLNVHTLRQVEDKLQNQAAASVKMAGILLKKQERVSAKSGKKFAFLQMSDATGVFEVMIFSESLAAARDFLQAGNALSISVSAEYRDDQIRLTGSTISLLDEALTGTLQDIEIIFKNASVENIQSFHDVIAAGGDGHAKIFLKLHMPESEIIRIELPNRLNFNAATRKALHKLSFVADVLDI